VCDQAVHILIFPTLLH